MILCDRMNVYGTKVSDNIWTDNNGQLICLGAILARTGSYDYLESEIVKNGNADKVIKVYRRPEDVFELKSIASFEHKPFCNDHPEQGVNAYNYKDYQCGHICNIRRGTGEYADCLLGDIVVTDPDAISSIKSNNKRQLSLGYDTTIVEENGKYFMTQIRGNHLALVDDGRAGVATIRDSSINNKGEKQGMIEKQKAASNARKAFVSKLYDNSDPVVLEKLEDEEFDGVIVTDDDLYDEEIMQLEELDDNEPAMQNNSEVTEMIMQLSSKVDSLVDAINKLVAVPQSEPVVEDTVVEEVVEQPVVEDTVVEEEVMDNEPVEEVVEDNTIAAVSDNDDVLHAEDEVVEEALDEEAMYEKEAADAATSPYAELTKQATVADASLPTQEEIRKAHQARYNSQLK